MSVQITGLTEAISVATNLQKQSVFACSQALNDTALSIQKNTLENLLPKKFTLRSKGAPWQKPGSKFGFNIKFSKKDNLEATIGSQASWLKLQEEGGTKLPEHITRKISEVPGFSEFKVAVPTKFWKDTLQIMRHQDKPSAILDSGLRKRAKKQMGRTGAVIGKYGKPFLMKKGGVAGIFVRTSEKRNPIRPLFFLFRSTRIKPVLEFVKSGTAIADRQFNKFFEQRFANALATAK